MNATEMTDVKQWQMRIKNSCENCKYFSDGLSEKGYCKLYHHNLTEPERICSRFEQKKEKRKDSPIEADYKKTHPKRVGLNIRTISGCYIL